MHDRPNEICQSSPQLVLVYLPVHWDLFLFKTVSPQVGCTMCHLSFDHTVVSTPLLPSSDGRTFLSTLISPMNAIAHSISTRTCHGSGNVCSLDLKRIRIRLFSSSRWIPLHMFLIFVRMFHDCHLSHVTIRLGPVLVTCS